LDLHSACDEAVNELTVVTEDVVEAALSTLVIGVTLALTKSCHLPRISTPFALSSAPSEVTRIAANPVLVACARLWRRVRACGSDTVECRASRARRWRVPAVAMVRLIRRSVYRIGG